MQDRMARDFLQKPMFRKESMHDTWKLKSEILLVMMKEDEGKFFFYFIFV